MSEHLTKTISLLLLLTHTHKPMKRRLKRRFYCFAKLTVSVLERNFATDRDYIMTLWLVSDECFCEICFLRLMKMKEKKIPLHAIFAFINYSYFFLFVFVFFEDAKETKKKNQTFRLKHRNNSINNVSGFMSFNC